MPAFRNPLHLVEAAAPDGGLVPTDRASRVARIIVYVAVSLAAIALGAAVLLVLTARIAEQDMRFERADRQALGEVLDHRAPLSPMNLLVVGLDKEKRGTRRADTIMLVRVDAIGGRIALLSVPRDCRVGLPALRNGNAVSKASPACATGLSQATKRWPDRAKGKDGLLASAAHNRMNPVSDHRFGLAFDLTHDPKHGADCAVVAEALRRSRDPRIEYVIFDGRTFSRETGWRWVSYTGADKHSEHMHVSVADDRWNDIRPWPGIAGPIPPDPGAFSPPLAPILDLCVPALRDRSAASKPALRAAKINNAYTSGGPRKTVATVKEFLDVPIHHYVEIDYQGFIDAVDAIGGVWVDVPVAIDDWNAASASPGHRAKKIPAGRQHLDGEHALTFARSRAYPDADLSRTRAQQSLVRSLLARVRTPSGLARLPLALSAIAANCRTDMSAQQIGWLLELSLPAARSDVAAATVPGVWRSPFLLVDEARKRRSVHEFEGVQRKGITPSEITVSVANGSSIPGAASAAGYSLYQEGYAVIGVGNLPTKHQKETLVVSREGDLKAAKQVAGELSVGKAIESHGDYDFVSRVLVVIGADWRE